MQEQRIEKRAYAEVYRTCDFTTVLDVADSITVESVVIFDKDTLDVSSSMIAETSIVSGNKKVRYKLKGGTLDAVYRLEIRITTASAQKFVEPFTVLIN